ncbi:hypothetical protein H0H92_006677, partial [Tricholoma furcatifolium]
AEAVELDGKNSDFAKAEERYMGAAVRAPKLPRLEGRLGFFKEDWHRAAAAQPACDVVLAGQVVGGIVGQGDGALHGNVQPF